jgi:hypothetical protein
MQRDAIWNTRSVTRWKLTEFYALSDWDKADEVAP